MSNVYAYYYYVVCWGPRKKQFPPKPALKVKQRRFKIMQMKIY